LVAMLWTLMPGPGDHFDFVLMHANSEVPANDLLTTQSEADPLKVRTISERSMEKNTGKPEVQRPDYCPVETTIGVIGGRWKPLILYHLLDGPQRFNALCRLIPSATRRMLTQHLRELEADGVIDRAVYEKVPPHVEYSFSSKGRTLMPILEAMAQWGVKNDTLSRAR